MLHLNSSQESHFSCIYIASANEFDNSLWRDLGKRSEILHLTSIRNSCESTSWLLHSSCSLHRMLVHGHVLDMRPATCVHCKNSGTHFLQGKSRIPWCMLFLHRPSYPSAYKLDRIVTDPY